MAEGHSENPLAHVVDHNNLELPWFNRERVLEIDLPNILGFQITRFMVMEVVAAALVILVIVPLARHVARHPYTRGRFLNLFEMFVLFIRDNVARSVIDGDHGDEHDDKHHAPAAGHGSHGHVPTHFDPDVDQTGLLGSAAGLSHAKPHAARAGRVSDLYVPFLWTIFFFILFNNLLGMIPGGASATGNINVTATLALLTLAVVVAAGMRASGVGGFFKNIVPKMDLPPGLKQIIWVMLFAIEIMGLLIRHIVLSVRLFANMLAGHIVLAVILGFVTMAAGRITYIVTPASILGAVAISMLELFVAFLQAYLFTFLASLFIGSAAHPH